MRTTTHANSIKAGDRTLTRAEVVGAALCTGLSIIVRTPPGSSSTSGKRMRSAVQVGERGMGDEAPADQGLLPRGKWPRRTKTFHELSGPLGTPSHQVLP
jgi:hypothetical protein